MRKPRASAVATVRWLIGVMLLALLIAGCDESPRYEVGRLLLARNGWDEVRVQAGFQRSGSKQSAHPDSFQVYLFDAHYDTLYAGVSRRLPVPDERLPNREQLLVEACGWFSGQTVCEQQGFLASPKRIRARADIAYPEEGNVEQGRYEVPVTLERKRYGSDSWERLTPEKEAAAAFLRAYVTGRERDAVRVPLARRGGQFRLAGHEGFGDFSYRLNTALYEKNRAQVTFEVYAAWGGDTTRVATLKRPVLPRTEGQLRADALHFAREGTRRLLRRLEVSDSSEAAVRLEKWKYNRLARRFDVHVELRWRMAFDGDVYRLDGLFRVREGGDDVTFQRKGGSERGKRLWKERAGQPVVMLDAIPSVPRLAEHEGAGRGAAKHEDDEQADDERLFDRRRGW